MQVSELDPKRYQKYENFVENHPLGSIHQTREWALFQTKTPGRDKFWVLVLEDNDSNIVASALLIRQTLPFQKSWIYSPRGPLVDYNNPEHLNLLFSKIKELVGIGLEYYKIGE
jgi:serine/alanine adding enzyme